MAVDLYSAVFVRNLKRAQKDTQRLSGKAEFGFLVSPPVLADRSHYKWEQCLMFRPLWEHNRMSCDDDQFGVLRRLRHIMQHSNLYTDHPRSLRDMTYSRQHSYEKRPLCR